MPHAREDVDEPAQREGECGAEPSDEGQEKTNQQGVIIWAVIGVWDWPSSAWSPS
ncbi:hypothetical protein [Streptomyces canus]|uniref:hypothetical protein n=1 Tax=Streptomyces canus TaxID=58343 RepID=UPI003251C813